jgi:phage baseplate assembly protein W
VDDHADFRGSGWRFPIVPTAGGGLTYIAGDDNILQSLRLLVETAAGERVMRPELGTTLSESLFSSDADQNLHALEQSVREAIQRWEPRVVVDRVEARRLDEPAGTVEVDVGVRIRRTNLARNLVFPFYLEGPAAP